MPLSPATSHGGGLAKLFDTTISGGSTTAWDTGANGIPATYDLLMLWVLMRTDEAVTLSTANMQFNGDTANHYEVTQLRNRNTTVAGVSSTSQPAAQFVCAGGSAVASVATVTRITIPCYRQTTFFKAGEITTATTGSTASANDVSEWGFTWDSTAAINQIKLFAFGSPNLIAGSRLLIYGV